MPGHGGWDGEGQKGGITEGHKKHFRVMNELIFLIAMMFHRCIYYIYDINTYVKLDQLVQLICAVNFMPFVPQ